MWLNKMYTMGWTNFLTEHTDLFIIMFSQVQILSWVLIFCVEFLELSHLTHHLSQAERKIYFVTSWANFQNDIYFTLNGRSCHFEWNQILYMSFDKFLLAVESRDLSQEYYKSAFFPKAEWWVAELLFCLSTTEAWTFWRMNALNPLKFTSH